MFERASFQELCSTAVVLISGVVLVGGRVQAGTTGADTCGGASVVSITPGPSGNPSVTVLSGDNTGATGPDCDFGQDNGIALWWEAFELTTCGIVTIELCGTDPFHFPSRDYLYTECPAAGTDCGVPVSANETTRNLCADFNITMDFGALPAGTYYYPIVADADVLVNDPGPYQITIIAERCVGACCDLDADTCADDVVFEDCVGANQTFDVNARCCRADCLEIGEQYDVLNVELLGNIPRSGFTGVPEFTNDIWGYVSPSGREYALIGLTTGTAVVEVTNPFEPVVVGEIPGINCIPRDIKTFDTYAYVTNDCGDGMDIIDLAEVDDGVITLTTRFTDSGFVHAHNLFINEQSGFAYVLGSNLANGGLLVLDLTDPAAPTIAGEWDVGYIHDTYVTTYTEGIYAGREIAFNFAIPMGLVVIDVTNKATMTTLSTLTYPNLVITHQGWLTPDRKHILFGDEGDEGAFGVPTTIYVADVQDLENTQIVNTFTNGRCNTDHNLMINGGLTYLANYGSGLRVFDTTDVMNVSEVAHFDTSPGRNNGAWGVYTKLPSGVILISDMDNGLFVLNYDCNGNEIDDTVDIANLTSDDCNANGLPDECEFDCDGNDESDSCEIIANPALDVDENGVLDLCECPVVPPPTLVVDDHAKSRYLSIVPGNAGVETALRVTLGSLDGYPADNGRVLWVGPPQQYPEEDTSDPLRTFTGATLACDPHFRDWGTLGTLQVFGGEIIPGSSYQVHAVHTNCASVLDQAIDFGSPLEPLTGKWGDVVSLYASDMGAPPQPDFNDVAAIVQKFLAAPTAPIKAFAQLQPNVAIPDRPVNFKDIATDVSAFSGTAYVDLLGITGPCACPSAVTCGATACVNDVSCSGGYCIDNFCTDACGRCAP